MTINLGAMPRFDGQAACAEIGGDDWFPEVGEWLKATEARRICNRCEVIDECLKWALDNAEPFGIWGGLTERQRYQITGKRRRNVA